MQSLFYIVLRSIVLCYWKRSE